MSLTITMLATLPTLNYHQNILILAVFKQYQMHKQFDPFRISKNIENIQKTMKRKLYTFSELLGVGRLLHFGLKQYEQNFMGRVYNNNLFYYIQMDYLTLSIRCILPKHAEKNCLLKIHNRQLDIHIQLQNTFVDNYEYVYKLWPCEIGSPHNIQLQLLEKGEGQTMKIRGVAQAKLIHTCEGELYKFHGNRSEGQVYLMCFKVEKAQGELQQSKEQAQLKKMNSQMQQSLLKYKEQIKNYRDFLYFTNNFIKQLNKDSDQSHQNSPSNKQYSPRSPIMINQIKTIPAQKEIYMIPTKRRQSIQVDEQETPRNKAVNIISKKPNNQIQKSETISQKCSVKSESRVSKLKAGSYLSKYRYLQQIQQSRLDSQKASNVMFSQVRQKTPVKRLIQQTQLESPEIIEKRKKQFEIASKIRQRRQHYFMLDQMKQVEEQMLQQNRSSVQTPINKLTSDLASKISKNSQKYQHNICQIQICEGKIPPRVNREASASGSTRSQTGLKEMLLYSEKKDSLHDHVIQSKQKIQAINKIKQPTEPKRSQAKSVQQSNITNVIIKSVAAPVRSTSNEQPTIEQKPNLSHNQSIIQNIARRRKVIAKNSASILGQMEDINHQIVNNCNRNEDLTGIAVSKLTIYGLKSIFYANFKSSTKKCIIEHNGHVYQTDLQRKNLKSTAWNDRMVLNALRPTEDLIFMVYSIGMDQVELEGTGIVKIIQLLSSSQKHFKLYLYFDNIAVGSIEFQVQREKRNYKRLSVSLPQIKSKSPPKQQFAAKTIKIKTQSDQSSKRQSHPSQQRQSSQTAQFNQYSSNSEFNQHEIYMPNNNQITKKIRNIKLTKLSRLGKPK